MELRLADAGARAAWVRALRTAIVLRSASAHEKYQQKSSLKF